jgi:hypothetical protein
METEFDDKLDFVQGEIESKIKKAIPVEQQIAKRMWLYGISDVEYWKMRDQLNISDPIFIKIGNYLRDETIERGGMRDSTFFERKGLKKS